MSNKWGFINEAASCIISDKQQTLVMLYFHLAGGSPFDGALL